MSGSEVSSTLSQWTQFQELREHSNTITDFELLENAVLLYIIFQLLNTRVIHHQRPLHAQVRFRC